MNSAGCVEIPTPTISDLAVFPALGEAWIDLGRELFIDKATLQSINLKESTPVKKQKALFRTCIKRSPPLSWREILHALLRINKGDLAKKVVDTFELPPELLSTTEEVATATIPIKESADSVTSSVPARVNKTEVLGRIRPDSGIYSPSSSTDFATYEKEKPKTAQIPVKAESHVTANSKSEQSPLKIESRDHTSHVSQVKQTNKSLADSDISGGEKCLVVADDGSAPPPSDSISGDKISYKCQQPMTAQIPIIQSELVGSSSSSKTKAYDSAPGSDGEGHYISEEDKEDSLLSSDDFHSAEEIPLDEENENDIDDFTSPTCNSSKNHKDVLFNSDKESIKNQLGKEKTKRLHEAVLNRNVEGIQQCVRGSIGILDQALEVSIV